jgi:hypothetical protein
MFWQVKMWRRPLLTGPPGVMMNAGGAGKANCPNRDGGSKRRRDGDSMKLAENEERALKQGIVEEIDDIVYRINLEHDVFIFALVFGKDELEEGPMSESPIYKVIQREGVPL